MQKVNMLRTTLVVVFVIYVAGVMAKIDESLISDETKNLMDSFHQTCVERTGVDEELIKRANDGQFPDDRNLKCYAKCLLVEAGAMDETSGDIKFDALTRYFSEDVLDKLKDTFSTCNDRTDKNDLCEKAYDLFKCYYNINQDLYFMA